MKGPQPNWRRTQALATAPLEAYTSTCHSAQI
eukprot:CAMPEP_0172169366 /NCGR_PEP_ID=MMETSP1050-20130122/10664_1 /TAXON_ID=233186 /ORGANISM="Cryptomonas curvata, Strain CCAP979/52" /LENGTH=31 /DNA_ID= /DNA_START= /DNA_END= /DNA_ORIENTATION=